MLCATLLLLGACAGHRPADLGPRDGRLAPCPDSPNCVSSQAEDPERRVAPFTYRGDGVRALARLRQLIENQPRTTLVSSETDYLHAEFRSRWLGFVDDLELLIDPERRVIHVRSASRLGYSDLGVNRRRVDHLRQHWSKPGDES